MLGTDARVVEPGRDRFGFEHLSPLVLHEVTLRAVHDAGNGSADRSTTGRLGTDQLSVGVGKPGEDARGVGAATDAGDDIVGHAAVEELGALLAGLVTDDTVELADHPRVRVRPHDRAKAVVGVLDRRHPVAHCLVDGVLERLAARLGGPNLGAEQLHPKDVELLALDVDGAHVDDTLHAEQGSGRRAGDTVLTGAGLGDDAGLAHALGEQGLAEHIVDLVAAGVVEVLSLEEDAAAEFFAETMAFRQRRRTARVGAQQMIEFIAERGITPGIAEGPVEFLTRGNQGLRDVHAAEVAEATRLGGFGHGHDKKSSSQLYGASSVCTLDASSGSSVAAARALAMNSRSLTGSFRPGADSTPVATSTPHGRTRVMASATLPACSPPASSTR